MSASDEHCGLDVAVREAAAALSDTEVGTPDVLLLLATGPGSHPSRMEQAVVLPLREVPGVPSAWHDVSLRAGELGGTRVWLMEDAPSLDHGPAPAWSRAFPVWLAAAAGARLMLHTSAGTALDATPERGLTPGSLVRCVDHLNLSGRSPLLGLGESRLGPLFPDQTRVHDQGLASLADRAASEQGLPLTTAVAACVAGPALSTPAELSWYARAGCDVSVQRLADPLIAAAHAGLSCLALVAVTDAVGEHDLDVATLVARAQQTSPSLDRLVDAVARTLGEVARERASEVDA